MPTRLRIASVNVNGVRAAYRKGMGEWLEGRDVDILTIQEVRASTADLTGLLGEGWHVIHDAATAKGRAGVAIAARRPIQAARTDFGEVEFDSAGRWLEADFDIDGTPITVVSAYVHSGEADAPKQLEKWKFLDAMEEHLQRLALGGGHVLVTGDLNVGHRELDIKNWKGNVKRAGFLPRERAYFDRVLGPLGEDVACADGTSGTGHGWVDIGRAHAGEVPGPYTWWSNRGQAFDNDSGWRIDYHIASPGLAARARSYEVDRAPAYDARWSDHAPVVVDYEIEEARA